MNASSIAKVLDILFEINDKLPENKKHKLPVPMFWGERGTGKTESHLLYGEQNNILTVIIPTGECASVGDIIGMPDISGKTTEFKVPCYFPPSDYDGKVLVLLDEPNRAEKDIEAVLHGLVQFKKIFLSKYSLPLHAVLSAAANPPSVEYKTNELSESLMNRFMHIHIESFAESSLKFFRQAKWDSEFIDFIAVNQDLINPKRGDYTFIKELTPSERAWDFAQHLKLSKTFNESSESFKMELIAGLVGEHAAFQFLKWTKENFMGPVSPKFIFGCDAEGKFEYSLKEITEKINKIQENLDLVSKTVDGILDYIFNTDIIDKQYKRFKDVISLFPRDFQFKIYFRIINFPMLNEKNKFGELYLADDEFLSEIGKAVVSIDSDILEKLTTDIDNQPKTENEK